VRWIWTIACAACGAALLFAAKAMDYPWFERHVLLPGYYPWAPAWVSRDVRAGVAIAGFALVCASWPAGRALARATLGGAIRVALAVALALAASELILRRGEGQPEAWRATKLEFRLGRPDPRFGWVLLPSRTTVLGPPEHPIAYAVDAWGDRAQAPQGAPDPDLPSLLVTGESIAAGHGVAYEQTFSALMGKDLGLQVVNVACGGYGSDQALLRLGDGLERLRRPSAAVITFVPVMLSRNVQDYRARLELREGALVLVPPADGFFAHLRLRDLLVNEVRYLSDRALRESIQLTAATLRESASAARRRGAEPLFAVVSIGTRRTLAEHPEGALLRELFVDQGLPYALVDVDPAELLPWDGHPDPAAHRRIARELVSVLRPRLTHAQ
jgi:hypothetical protein